MRKTFSKSNNARKIHIFTQLAHIECMGKLFFFVLIIVIVCAILFFPIYIETNAHYDMNRRKFTLGIYLYKILRIFGGYLATYNGGLAFHVSEKKAIIIPYTQVNKERKRFSIFRAFRLKSLYLTVETGAEYLVTMATTQKILETYFTLKTGRPCLYRGVLWLNNGDLLRISLQFTAYFNLFIILRFAYKVLKEKIKRSCRKKMKNSTT